MRRRCACNTPRILLKDWILYGRVKECMGYSEGGLEEAARKKSRIERVMAEDYKM